MAELAAFGAGASLASSIITFIDFSIEFAKLVKDISGAQGGLPMELGECRTRIDTVVEWVRAIQHSLDPPHVETSGDILLRGAILRFLGTCDELLDECAYFIPKSRVVPEPQNVTAKTKNLLQNIKLAGKIYWNKDKIQGFSLKLKEHQADVDSHLATRTSMMINDVAVDIPRILEGIARLEERPLAPPTGHRHTISAAKPAFIMPYASNPDFVGRQKIFDELRNCLFQDGTQTHQPRAALWGLGGAGKSQIAIKYAYWLRETRPTDSVFWIHCSNIERFRLAYQEVATHLSIPGIDTSSPDFLLTVKNWLMRAEHGTWLMILDNADESELFFGLSNTSLTKYIPDCSHGSILITTRNRQVATKVTRAKRGLIEVPQMTDLEAKELLTNMMDESILDVTEIPELAKLMDHLPLALSQAGAFMQENSISIRRFLQIYAANDHDLIESLSEDFQSQGRDNEVPNAVTATWMISFEQIQSRNHLAADLMSLMVFLDRQGISHMLLSQPNQSAKELDKALLLLIAFSFIHPNEKRDSYQMHRLVQLVMQQWLENNGRMEIWAATALTRINECFSDIDIDDLHSIASIVPHAQRVLSFECFLSSAVSQKASVMHNLAKYYLATGSLRHAEELEKVAFKIRRTELGLAHADTVQSLGTLAQVCRGQGQYEDAARMLMQTLRWTQERCGKEHPDTLSILNLLANIYQDLGLLANAEQLYVQVRNSWLRKLGTNNPLALSAMCDLASLYQIQNRLEEAEEAHLQNKQIALNVFGVGHHRCLAIALALAKTYIGLGRDIQAESLLRDTLRASNQLLGPEHPFTISCIFALARFCSTHGHEEEGLLLQEKTLAACTSQFGENNPTTRQVLQNHAFTLWKLNHIDKAKNTLSRALEARLRVRDCDESRQYGLDNLAIPEEQKVLLLRLVKYNISTRNSSLHGVDSAMPNGGLNIHLHGPPGCGKSFTIGRLNSFKECISVYTRMPVLVINSSDLGDSISETEELLKFYFHISYREGYILQIDNADPFMGIKTRGRSSELSGVVLRALETNNGIAFLLTNNLAAVQSAFERVIHVSIYYQELTGERLRFICQRQLTKILEEGLVDISPEDMGQILHFMVDEHRQVLNGRKIRHILKTAMEIAEAEEFQKRNEIGDCSNENQKPKLSVEIVRRVATDMADVYGFLSNVMVIGVGGLY